MHQCSVCAKTFTRKKNLYQHLRRKHNIEPTLTEGKIICPLLCVEKFRTYTELRIHLETFHKIVIEKEELDFPDCGSFETWKKQFELGSGFSYVRRMSERIRKEYIETDYVCNRSGHHISTSKGIRRTKKIGSNKIGFTCPSTMKVCKSISDGKFHVLLWKTHVGHEGDIKRISMSKKSQPRISNYITYDVCAVLPAAGIGERMGLDTPKQYISVHGKPIICYTVEAFLRIPYIKKVVVVVSSENLDLMLSTFSEKSSLHDERLMITEGCASRHQSIESGLKALKTYCELKPEVVVIHDGVRPFFSEDILCKVVTAAKEHGAAGIACPLVSTVISVDEDGFLDHSLDRSKYRASEMPQAFHFNIISEAYSKCSEVDLENGTECLHLVQKYCNVKAKVLVGSPDLWKITHRKDIYTAAACVKENQPVAIYESHITTDFTVILQKCLFKRFKEVNTPRNCSFSLLNKYPNFVHLWSNKNKNVCDVINQVGTLYDSKLNEMVSIVHVIFDAIFAENNFFDIQKQAKEISKKLRILNILIYFIISRDCHSTEYQEEIADMVTSLLFDSNPYISGSIFIV